MPGTILVIECIALAAGVVSQAFHGYYRLQFVLYSSDLLLMKMPPVLFLSAMIKFGQLPDCTCSDFYGYGPFLQGRLWFSLCWLVFCLLLAVASVLLWQRVSETARTKMQPISITCETENCDAVQKRHSRQ